MNGFTRRGFIHTAAFGPVWLASGPAAAAAVDETGFQRIGGIDQWIATHGTNADNPPILYLHGGPGEAQSPFLKEFLPWRRDFIVVNWDQRGAGKTFGRNGTSTPGMTVEQMADDVGQIAQLIRTRFPKRKVILVGQSWGSFLGVHAIKRHPELFCCYVGTGQVVSFAATVADTAQWARKKATEAGDKETLAALDKASSLAAPDRMMALAGAAHKWSVSPQDQPYAKMIEDFHGTPPYPKGDVADWMTGARFSGAKLGPAFIAMDLHTLGLDMPVPVFVVQGRDDHIAGFEPARA
jgi:pimeloyl-ACP methyl ester carboxylesterase